ncbi:hypothetical protein ATS76_03955 [Pseudoalteromonas sp. 10-33]|nr:hypothetical protein ATS76_03955 [Pseudoalteromonas sp. 10-33]
MQIWVLLADAKLACVTGIARKVMYSQKGKRGAALLEEVNSQSYFWLMFSHLLLIRFSLWIVFYFSN